MLRGEFVWCMFVYGKLSCSKYQFKSFYFYPLDSLGIRSATKFYCRLKTVKSICRATYKRDGKKKEKKIIKKYFNPKVWFRFRCRAKKLGFTVRGWVTYIFVDFKISCIFRIGVILGVLGFICECIFHCFFLNQPNRLKLVKFSYSNLTRDSLSVYIENFNCIVIV